MIKVYWALFFTYFGISVSVIVSSKNNALNTVRAGSVTVWDGMGHTNTSRIGSKTYRYLFLKKNHTDMPRSQYRSQFMHDCATTYVTALSRSDFQLKMH